MNKLISKALLVAVTMCGMVNAANIVTYTAGSSVSQKDADQKAMEGVAKQIGTRVKSEFVTKKSEDAAGNITETADSFKGSYTNVLLKGAKIVPGAKKNGMFQSTVTVDLDQLASKILLDLDGIRAQMKSKDSVIRLDMMDRDYRKVSSDMVALGKLSDRYNEELENLSYVQAVPKNLLLESTLGELTEFLTSSLSTIKIETDITSEALNVTVTDFAGPVVNFPMVLIQDRKDLVTEKTDEDGNAVFSLSDVMKRKPSGEVVVMPDMNFKFVRSSALVKKTVAYSAEKRDCSYKLVCNGPATECGAMQKFLSESGFTIVNQPGVPELNVTLSFSDKPNSNKTLYTSKATIAFKSGTVELIEQPQGVGRDDESAHVKAITKLPATKILQTYVNKNCKK